MEILLIIERIKGAVIDGAVISRPGHIANHDVEHQILGFARLVSSLGNMVERLTMPRSCRAEDKASSSLGVPKWELMEYRSLGQYPWYAMNC